MVSDRQVQSINQSNAYRDHAVSRILDIVQLLYSVILYANHYATRGTESSTRAS